MSIGISTHRANTHNVRFGNVVVEDAESEEKANIPEDKDPLDDPATKRDIKDAEERIYKYVSGAFNNGARTYLVNLKHGTDKAIKTALFATGDALQTAQESNKFKKNERFNDTVEKLRTSL